MNPFQGNLACWGEGEEFLSHCQHEVRGQSWFCFPPQLRWICGRRTSPGHEVWRDIDYFRILRPGTFPTACHDRHWPRLCKDLGIKKKYSRTVVVMVHSYWKAGKKYLLKMPCRPVKPKLGKDSGMRRELPLLVASVLSIRLSLMHPYLQHRKEDKAGFVVRVCPGRKGMPLCTTSNKWRSSKSLGWCHFLPRVSQPWPFSWDIHISQLECSRHPQAWL